HKRQAHHHRAATGDDIELHSHGPGTDPKRRHGSGRPGDGERSLRPYGASGIALGCHGNLPSVRPSADGMVSPSQRYDDTTTRNVRRGPPCHALVGVVPPWIDAAHAKGLLLCALLVALALATQLQRLLSRDRDGVSLRDQVLGQ